MCGFCLKEQNLIDASHVHAHSRVTEKEREDVFVKL